MKVFHFSLTLTVLALLGGLTPSRGADRVLVPGNPPLTQKIVELYQQMWEWYCDIRMTPEQRHQHTRHFITFWKKQTSSSKQYSLSTYRSMEKNWRDIRQMKAPERNRKRVQGREQWMAAVRKSPDDISKFMVSVYNAAYKPGGAKNPILAEGDPPLTQAIIDLDMAFVELVLDLGLTEQQRREYQRLSIADWKRYSADEKRQRSGNLELLAALPTWNNYRRNEIRSLNRPKSFAAWAKGSTTTARWLAALQKSAFEPGSPHNPVLVDAKPPLTQFVVNRYADYLEIMVDLSVSGGFTTQERQILQAYLIKGWKKMTADTREELLADMDRWSESAGRGTVAAAECIRAMRPKLLAELRVARDDPLSQWLLEVRGREDKLHRQNLALEKLRHDGVIKALEAMPEGRGSGYWKYNPNKRRYYWVLYR